MDTTQAIRYCLYARKSSESDERQAMSIDSQIKEMSALIARDGVVVKEVRQESHSAKNSGQRPVFNQLLTDIRAGVFNGILTWAPDRLSRNAGDLGMLVDLMDQGKLAQIKTFSQNFGNNPNEKFLLMILCSQAKLENDQKGINVKRGIRAKCEMGWRPGIAPLGYMNRAFGGVKDIIIDPDRAPLIQEMFQRVSDNGHSGRTIKKWLDQSGFTTRQKKYVTLSLIYLMLRNPFYYGKFEFPIKSGNWYEGKQPPLISKELFDKAQEQLKYHPKSPWGSKIITYKGLFKCGSCGANIIGEEKYRKRKHNPPNHHVYYHCARQMGQCREPYIEEKKLEKQILKYIQFMEMAHGETFAMTSKLKQRMDIFKSTREEILYRQDILPEDRPMNTIDFANYIIYYGNPEEKRELVEALDKQLYIKDKLLTSSVFK